MIFHNTTVFTDGSITSFESEVTEHHTGRVFHIKSSINYQNEETAKVAAANFWANYPKTDEELRAYLDYQKVEVQILGLVQ